MPPKTRTPGSDLDTALRGISDAFGGPSPAPKLNPMAKGSPPVQRGPSDVRDFIDILQALDGTAGPGNDLALDVAKHPEKYNLLAMYSPEQLAELKSQASTVMPVLVSKFDRIMAKRFGAPSAGKR